VSPRKQPKTLHASGQAAHIPDATIWGYIVITLDRSAGEIAARHTFTCPATLRCTRCTVGARSMNAMSALDRTPSIFSEVPEPYACAVGVGRQWRSTLIGVVVALVALAAVVAALGPALALIPIDALRVVVGALLLIFGLQWLRKAIPRATGHVGAGIAVVLVTLVGAIVHKPLSRVSENTMKFVVGVMLTTFGIF
jgi:hypothetical protein